MNITNANLLQRSIAAMDAAQPDYMERLIRAKAAFDDPTSDLTEATRELASAAIVAYHEIREAAEQLRKGREDG